MDDWNLSREIFDDELMIIRKEYWIKKSRVLENIVSSDSYFFVRSKKMKKVMMRINSDTGCIHEKALHNDSSSNIWKKLIKIQKIWSITDVPERYMKNNM